MARQKKWTRDTVLEEAKKYTNRKDFKQKSAGAYAAASSMKMISECTAHMEPPAGPHNKRTHKDYAALLAEKRPEVGLIGEYVNANTKAKFRCECGNSFCAFPSSVINNGAACVVCSHKSADGTIGASSNNAVYAWEWVRDGEPTGIIKVGLTSWHLGRSRIEMTARDNGQDYRLLFLLQTPVGEAKRIEQALLSSGSPVDDLPESIVDGRTEFRTFSERNMETILQMAKMSGKAELQAA